MRRHMKRIHEILDNPVLSGEASGSESAELREYRKVLSRLEESKVAPSSDMVERIMDAMPAARPRRVRLQGIRRLWTPAQPGLAPALLRAAATVAIALAASSVILSFHASRSQTTFVLHAPKAHSVELVGTFNQWQKGDIVLSGPDANGDWATTVSLPQGRHEYMFVVDKVNWTTDPKAAESRPDGFGGKNSVIET